MKNRIFFFGIFIFFWLSWSYCFLQNNRPYNSTVACAKEARARSARYAVGRSYVTFAVFNSIFKRTEEGFTLAYLIAKNYKDFSVAVLKTEVLLLFANIIWPSLRVLLHVFYFGGSLCTQSIKRLPSLAWSYLHFFQLRFDSITHRHHTTIPCTT